MKGVAIFDERADLAFYSLDKEMERFILVRMQELEMEQTGVAVSSVWCVCVCVSCPEPADIYTTI